MTLLLGIDTGGTFTDAVLLDEAADPAIRAKAKAPTTHHDLSIGISGALDAVLAKLPDATVGLVSLSTTLATNALVEGRGGRICLILIGFDDKALSRAGLAEAVGQDPVVFVAGGHTPSGARQAPLDTQALIATTDAQGKEVDAFAIVAHFGTRDPVDEIAASDLLAARTGLPITCGHELASELGGPKRAVTAVLNARLIGTIADLLNATEQTLAARNIAAPLMLVRGDGSLVSAAFARARPIETILSGPAASLVGASYLTGQTDAVVSDIGGTTTDIAILTGGRPALSSRGATVGGHRTMVGAVDIATHGLGGDSDVQVDNTSLTPRVTLGPRRVEPVAALATRAPDAVHAALDEALARTMPNPNDGRFVTRIAGRTTSGLRDGDRALLVEIGDAPLPVAAVLKTRLREAALRRLVGRGLVLISGFTPTDAAHVLGDRSAGDTAAARKAAALLARQRDAGGRAVAETPEALAASVRTALIRRSAEVLLDATLVHDGFPSGPYSTGALAAAALNGHEGASRLSIGLAQPLIGLGASAPLYYPGIADMLGTQALVPPDADVANAIGAVVGQVRLTVEATVTQPAEGRFRIHLPDRTEDHATADAARSAAFDALRRLAQDDAAKAGAEHVELDEDWAARTANIDGKELFVEATARVVATGRPRIVA